MFTGVAIILIGIWVAYTEWRFKTILDNFDTVIKSLNQINESKKMNKFVEPSQ